MSLFTSLVCIEIFDESVVRPFRIMHNKRISLTPVADCGIADDWAADAWVVDS